MKKIAFSLVLLVTTSIASSGQHTVTSIFKQLLASNGDTIVWIRQNEVISTDDNLAPMFDDDISSYLRENVTGLPQQDGRIMIKKAFRLHGIPQDPFAYWFRNFHFTQPVVIDIPGNDFTGFLKFNNCIFEQGLFVRGNFKSAILSHCTIRNHFALNSKSASGLVIESTNFSFDSRSIWPKFAWSENPAEYTPYEPALDSLQRYGLTIAREDFNLNIDNIQSLQLRNNTFESTGLVSLGTIRTKECNDFYFTNNTTNQLLNFNELVVRNSLVMTDNALNGGISLSTIELPAFINKIKLLWDQLAGGKLLILERKGTGGFGEKLDAIYRAQTPQELTNNNIFIELTGSYQSLLNVYKVNGDLASANACFAELKDLQGRRLQEIYLKEGGFKNYFSWKINRLLKVYTNHGTDPSLAVIISLYVILAFAIVFYFFPSDWDLTSKSQLITHFREFITRNEKGYIKPLLHLLVGFFVSLINALALSLNAFTTLGFGNIPTRGIARYLCILEGFIGWFLLSIFTVALINQVSI